MLDAIHNLSTVSHEACVSSWPVLAGHESSASVA